MEQDYYNGTVTKKDLHNPSKLYVYKRSINHKQPNPLTFLQAAACVSRKTRREIITKHPKISLIPQVQKKLSAIHVTYPNQVLTFNTGEMMHGYNMNNC